MLGNSIEKSVGVLFVVALSFALSACGSGRLKARQDQREKSVSASGLYCEWVNGEKHSDMDIELNLQMAKRCDSNKPFSLTPFKNGSDVNGIMYCCGVGGADSVPGNSYAPPVPRRTNSGPAAKRVNPQPSVAPAANSQTPAALPALTPVPANSEATDLSSDAIVEDK